MKYKSGDKVVIKSKNYWGPLKSSNIYKNGKYKGYWYFQYYESKKKNLCVIDCDKNSSDGDFFLESDIEPYCENNIKKLNDGDFKF